MSTNRIIAKRTLISLLCLLLCLALLAGCGESRVQANSTPIPRSSDEETHDHTWSPATCTRPATCTLCGATQGSALGHSWVAATYDQPRRCSVCGETDGAPLTPAGPSARDLDEIGSPITYPTTYLSEYKTRTVIAEHEICVYIYYSAKATEANRLPYTLAHLTEVTVIAEKNGLSCVIYQDADGYTRSGWVTSSHLVVQ